MRPAYSYLGQYLTKHHKKSEAKWLKYRAIKSVEKLRCNYCKSKLSGTQMCAINDLGGFELNHISFYSLMKSCSFSIIDLKILGNLLPVLL